MAYSGFFPGRAYISFAFKGGGPNPLKSRYFTDPGGG